MDVFEAVKLILFVGSAMSVALAIGVSYGIEKTKLIQLTFAFPVLHNPKSCYDTVSSDKAKRRGEVLSRSCNNKTI